MSTHKPTDLGELLNMAFGLYKEGWYRQLAEAGFDDMGSSFCYVFRFLKAEPASLRALADHLDITPQGALKLVNEMEGKGYVERQDDPTDGRSKRLVLTPRALQALVAARRFHERFERDLAKRVGQPCADAARRALENIVAQHEGERPPGMRPL